MSCLFFFLPPQIWITQQMCSKYGKVGLIYMPNALFLTLIQVWGDVEDWLQMDLMELGNVMY